MSFLYSTKRDDTGVEFLRESDTVEAINLYEFINSENNYINEYYFIARDPEYREKARKALLKSLRVSGRWKCLFCIEEGNLKFVPAGVDEYMNDDTKFRELILLAMNWTAGFTGGGTEMLSLLLKNKMSAVWNIINGQGQ